MDPRVLRERLVLIGLAGAVLHLPRVWAASVLLFGAAWSYDVIMNVEGARLEQALGCSTLPLMHACFSVGAVAGAGLGAAALALGVNAFTHLATVAGAYSLVAF